MTKKKKANESTLLTGWASIARFLGQPIAVAERWAKEGMPVQRKGRYVAASADELSKWLGRESGAPIHITQGTESNLLESLRTGLKQARRPASCGIN
jgi:hypothetical protein